MIGRIVLGGIALCAAGGAYLGWRLARADVELPKLPARALAVLAAEPDAAAADADSAAWRAEESSSTFAALEPELAPANGRRARVALGSASRGASDAEAPEAEHALPGGRAPLAAPTTHAEAVAVVDALCDDGVRGNAMRAVRALTEAGPIAVPALARALDSRDEQQRALAACTLAWIEGSPRSPALARELLAILTPEPGQRFHAVSARPWHASVGRANVDERWVAFRALEADAELFAHVERALEARLDGADPVQRFDAARLVLAHPNARSRRAALDVLVRHLEDNALSDDAAIAMRLLARAGAEALPSVLPAVPGRDEQSATLLAHLLSYLDPSHPAARRVAPKALARMGFRAGDMVAMELTGPR
ncbi:MAG: hypothetical protein IPJ77_02540 [Planctomycetes bacterium]|nr:hypothetical protein [Planctomycetota bacterium]